jgi:MOSC domain-containing protein YiiM
MSLAPHSPLRILMETFPRTGRLDWIGVRPASRTALLELNHVEVIADHGLAGDHKARRTGGKRQVSLIQLEHLHAVASILSLDAVDPVLARRNLVVSGINLFALRNECFEIGGVQFEGAGPCEPCSRMEQHLGAGGYNAMRGHGGIIARAISSGVIRLGDAVGFKKIPCEPIESGDLNNRLV